MADRLRLSMTVATVLLPFTAGCAVTDRTGHPGRMPPSPAAAIAPHSVDELGWIAGYWAGGDGESVTEEIWLPAAGGTMVGVNRTRSGDRTVFFELLRIEPAEGGAVVYLGSPRGRQPPTPFWLVELRAGVAVFENPGHDYPQRITYRRSGDELFMRVEDLAATRGEEWFLVRAELP